MCTLLYKNYTTQKRLCDVIQLFRGGTDGKIFSKWKFLSTRQISCDLDWKFWLTKTNKRLDCTFVDGTHPLINALKWNMYFCKVQL